MAINKSFGLCSVTGLVAAATITSGIALQSVQASQTVMSPLPMGRFTLAIPPDSRDFGPITAKVLVTDQLSASLVSSRWLDDLKYKFKDNKQEAKLIQGVNPGDLVIVKLFDKNDRFIGHTQFQVQDQNTHVTVVTSDQLPNFGIVRTVYGVDADRNQRIDPEAITYDYFTLIADSGPWQQSEVTYLNASQGIDLSDFNRVGLP
jgi:hypothetical protein